MADKMSIDKNDPGRDESGDESTGSSPDAEPQANTTNATTQEQQPKRKGGRKPVCSSVLFDTWCHCASDFGYLKQNDD
jgi:hypothetical protein